MADSLNIGPALNSGGLTVNQSGTGGAGPLNSTPASTTTGALTADTLSGGLAGNPSQIYNSAAKNPVSYPYNGSDTSFSTPQQLAAAQGLGTADFSQVGTINQGQAPTTKFYKFANSPTVYQNSNYGTINSSGTTGSTGSSAGGSYTAPVTNQGTTGGPYQPVTANPGTQGSSSTLSNPPTTMSDIQSILLKNLDNQDAFINQVTSAMTDPAFTTAQSNALNANQEVSNFDLSTQEGINNIQNKPIGLEFQQGQEAALTRDAALTRSSLVNQANYYQNVLTSAQTTRQQKIDAASFMYDASRNKLADTINLYTATAPQNIGTNYNPATGQLTATTRNPLTGEVTVSPLANIGAQKTYVSTTVQQLPDGSTAMIGVDALGNVTTTPLFDASGTPVNSQTAQATSNTVPSNLSGTFPQGAQSQPNSAASVNNVSGLKNPQTGQFVSYANPMDSLAATAQDIANKEAGQTSTGLNGNSTLTQFVNTWINGDPNKVGGYTANDVASTLQQYGVNATATTPIGQINPTILAAAVAKHETGFTISQTGPQVAGATTGSNGSNGTPAQITPQYIQQVVSSLPPVLQGAVKYLPDGTPYFDGNQLTSAQQETMAQVQGSKVGIPFINKDDSGRLQGISTTLQNLQDYKTFADSKLENNVGATTGIAYKLGGLLGNTTKTQFDSYYATALGAIEALAGGTGSGFRMTASEIATAQSNLPTIWDTKAQADTKIATLQNQLYNKIAQSIPGWVPPTNQ